jgi:hypothetical protein
MAKGSFERVTKASLPFLIPMFIALLYGNFYTMGDYFYPGPRIRETIMAAKERIRTVCLKLGRIIVGIN